MYAMLFLLSMYMVLAFFSRNTQLNKFKHFIFQVDEWVEQNIRPLQEKTEKLLQVVDKLTARNTWPRRPIP